MFSFKTLLTLANGAIGLAKTFADMAERKAQKQAGIDANTALALSTMQESLIHAKNAAGHIKRNPFGPYANSVRDKYRRKGKDSNK